MGTASRLRSPWDAAHSLNLNRESCARSAISSVWRWSATQPTAFSPKATVLEGRSSAIGSDAVRNSRVRAASFATQKLASGTATSSPAASAMARSTSSMSSEEDTMCARRARLRRRAARTSRAW